MQGDLARSRAAAAMAAGLGQDALTDIAQGYADLATYRAAAAEDAFRRALQRDSQNPTALLGLGLAQIRRGDLAAGTVQLQNAAAADPASSLLRSYLGKAYFTGRDGMAAAKQYAIAKELDSADPTPWFYDAIRLQLANQPVAALRSIDRSIERNDNRAPFRSRLLLDRDQATRGASLAQIYQDLGFTQLGINEAGRALVLDPASSSRPSVPVRRLSGRAQAGGGAGQRAAAVAALAAGGDEPGPAQPGLRRSQRHRQCRAGPCRLQRVHAAVPAGRLAAQRHRRRRHPEHHRQRADGDGTVGSRPRSASANTTSTPTASVPTITCSTRSTRHSARSRRRTISSLQAEYRRRETNQGDRSLNFDPDDNRRNLRREHRSGHPAARRQARSVASDVDAVVGGAQQPQPSATGPRRAFGPRGASRAT